MGAILPGQRKSFTAEICGNNHSRTVSQGQFNMKQPRNSASKHENTCTGLNSSNPLAAKNTG